MVVHPKDEEVKACPLEKFKSNEAIQLAQLLRKHYTFQKSGSWSVEKKGVGWLYKLKENLRL